MNIIVTGASRGIGYELVKQFSTISGARILAVSRNEQQLLKLKKECAGSKAEVIPVPADLSDPNLCSAVLLPQIKKHISHLDILVNNAGAIVNKPFKDLSPQDIQSVYNVNVFSVMNLIKDLLPLMGGANPSHIINISSMGGFQGSMKFPGLSAYSSSKAAVACLSECLAEEFKDMNIAVNCLALGAVQTEMLAEAFPGYKAPLKPEEMATFIADFAQNGHKFMNGKTLPVSLSTP
jgi:NAD(P)-dependent dehydrogenase (short-subunit alcohol dehydrogenase family)